MRHFLLFSILSLCLIATGCDDVEVIELEGKPIDVITDIGGAGNFKAINMGTNDTLLLSGYTIEYPLKRMTVKNGNVVKLLFEPVDKYSDYKFESTFILNDGSGVSGPAYEYVTKDINKGDYTILLSAKSTDQQKSSDENTIISTLITAFAAFTLSVVE